LPVLAPQGGGQVKRRNVRGRQSGFRTEQLVDLRGQLRVGLMLVLPLLGMDSWEIDEVVGLARGPRLGAVRLAEPARADDVGQVRPGADGNSRRVSLFVEWRQLWEKVADARRRGIALEGEPLVLVGVDEETPLLVGQVGQVARGTLQEARKGTEIERN